MQRFDRQISEDTRDPSTKWGKDITPADAGAEDPDDEDNLPIPSATTYKEPALVSLESEAQSEIGPMTTIAQ